MNFFERKESSKEPLSSNRGFDDDTIKKRLPETSFTFQEKKEPQRTMFNSPQRININGVKRTLERNTLYRREGCSKLDSYFNKSAFDSLCPIKGEKNYGSSFTGKQNPCMFSRIDGGDAKGENSVDAIIETYRASSVIMPPKKDLDRSADLIEEWTEDEEDLFWAQIESLREKKPFPQDTKKTAQKNLSCRSLGTSICFGAEQDDASCFVSLDDSNTTASQSISSLNDKSITSYISYRSITRNLR